MDRHGSTLDSRNSVREVEREKERAKKREGEGGREREREGERGAERERDMAFEPPSLLATQK